MSQRLKHGTADDAESGHEKAGGNDAQGGDAYGQQVACVFPLSLEQAQEDIGKQLEQGQSYRHNADRVGDGQPDGFDNPLGLAGAVVVGHDGNHSVVQTEDGHENKGLKLEINSEYRRGSGGESKQNLIHAKDHDRTDGLHDDGGQAHAVDAANNFTAGAQATEGHLEFRISGQRKIQSHQPADDLTSYGSHSGPSHLQPGEAEQAKDQNGV